jgi:hypothetical protein
MHRTHPYSKKPPMRWLNSEDLKAKRFIDADFRADDFQGCMIADAQNTKAKY